MGRLHALGGFRCCFRLNCSEVIHDKGCLRKFLSSSSPSRSLLSPSTESHFSHQNDLICWEKHFDFIKMKVAENKINIFSRLMENIEILEITIVLTSE
ncbi:hypothetical protein CEXT_170021 [Caerostris extrusa]|uniref:Uncharacterized protein n=1 Tax=Caerostris extrusa TaxID=172846 RepID=A0AAV4XTB0_CAEEX|nr:hypothetical protein CEXT_170021 [Caerostris extrusa]